MKLTNFLLIVFVMLAGCTSRIDDEVNLIIACKNGDLVKIEEYASKLETVNYISIKGDAPLSTAAYNGHLSAVKLLLTKGADKNFKDSYGRTAADSAKKMGHEKIIVYLRNLDESGR